MNYIRRFLKNPLHAGIVILVALILVLSKCGRNTPSPDLTLKDNEKAKIVIKKGSVGVAQRGKQSVTKYAPDRTTIVVDNDGMVRVHVKTFGVGIQPGIGAGIVGDRLMLTLDTRWVYWRRLGLHTGTGIDFNKSHTLLNPYFALSYALPFDVVSNTSIYVGKRMLKSELVLGLRVAF